MPSVLDFESPEQPIQPTGSAVKPFVNITPRTNTGVLPGAVLPTANMPPQDMRGFADIDKTRQSIYDNVLKAAQEMPEFSNNRYKMRLVNAQYVDNDKPTIAERKKAILRQESLERRLQGTWQLLDLNDNVVDEKKVTMARIPKLTNGGTFVLNGVEYTLANQARLRPGVFTREKANGEIESHVNVMPGKGVSHRYTLDPEKGVFKMTLGQASIPLFPLLRALGAKDDQIRKAWGNELYEINAKNNDPQAVDKIAQKMLRKGDFQLDAESRTGKLRELFNKMELDDVVTNRTLGKPYKNLSIDAMLDSTRKILAVQKREADPDDRDAMAYQMIYGPEDFFAERVRSAYKVMNPILWKATFKNNLSSLSSGFLDKHVKAAIISSGLGQPSEEVNNAEILGQLTRMSRLGEGGIPSLDAVPEEARSVQPSHFGYVDPLLTPESLKVGVDSRLAMSTMKGKNGKIYTKFLNVKTGEPEWKSPQDVADSVIAFPKEMDDPNNETVAALVSGKIKYVPREQVEFTLPHMEDSFNPLVNMIPLKSATKGQRVMMGARMTTQALPLKNAEAPFVQAGVPGDADESFEERYGSYMGAIKSNAEGQVVEVTPDVIKIKGADGKVVEHELHNNLPYNRKTFLHNTPTVKVGDMVNKDTLLAKSNFTNDKGATALGLNLRTAYVPYKGANFEDAIVISQSAAKKLSSEHMYQHDTEFEEGLKHGKKNYISMFPSSYDRKVLETLDDDGVVKPGTIVHKDMPLILQIREKERAHNQIGRSRGQLYNDSSVTWEHDDPGVVTDVEKTKKGMLVTVKGYSEMKVADKLSGRYGDKGVIADIIPDDKMPKDSEGKPFEVLVNPLGIISRTNPSQMVEAALGKIAERTGKRYAVKDFSDIKDMVQFAKDELKKHGLKDLEDVEDPDSNRKIKNVFTGNRFFMKLHHMAESKGSGRGLGSYTAEDTPAKGGPQGSKRVSLADTNALLSHGALEVITDAKSIRGQKNQDYWASFMAGKTPPPPKVPLVYGKFFNQLRSAGINPVRNGPRIQIMALTNKDIDELAKGREITSAETVDWKEGLKPIKGGLFDPSLTGGHGGNQWSYIKLHEPMPNPVMEEPIRRVLGLTKNKFMDILAGKDTIGDQTGPQAIKNALSNINLEKATREAEYEWRNGRKSTKDAALKRWSVLKHSAKLGLNPSEWMMDKIPVLPPAFRPVSVMGATGRPLVADANYLYKEAFEANEALKETAGFSSNLSDERTALYKSFKAVTGLGDPVSPKNQERQVKGVLKYIFGDNPKFSCYDDKTEILTEKGWVPFPQYQGGCKVATLNTTTGAFEWQTPTAVQHYDYNGQLFSFKTKRGLDSVVTPNHRNLVRYRNNGKTADDMENGWDVEQAYITAANKNRKWFRTAASSWKGHRLRPSFLPKTCKLEDFAEFVGWWVAEGWLGDRKKGRVQISQASKQTEYCKRIDSVVRALGLPVSMGEYIKETKKGVCVVTQWSIGSKRLARWLDKHAGQLAHGKALSYKIKDWSASLLQRFLQGYLCGDGTKRNRAIKNNGGVTHKNKSTLLNTHTNFHTVSEKLAGDLQEIACKLGVTAKIKPLKPVDGCKPMYRVNLSSSKFIVAEGGDNAEVVEYTGGVHCVTVPNGIVYVRRNGKPLFSGNSMQRKLLSTTVDVVGRGVITPNPDLDMDQVGLPESKAWEIYKPFIVRRLARRGVAPLRAAELVEQKDKAAKDALLQEMDERPVIITRAPVLHRYGVMAFKPQLTKAETLQIPPAIVTGFGADFDGDTMNYHVPVSDGAVKDALEKMLPSKNLLSTKNFKAHQLPKNEYQGGLYHATAFVSNKPERYFATKADAIRAYKNGEIESDQKVVILN